LKKKGHEAVLAPNGKEALQRFRHEMVDLVITDLVMPAMSGRELVERIRQLSPAPRIICTSGYVWPAGQEDDGTYLHQKAGIGTAIGIIPGIGSVVAQWLSYGHAKQTSKRSQEFGLGCIEGVIAPESGNNAKEGGSLFTALAFGLPSGAPMVIILAADSGGRAPFFRVAAHRYFWTSGK
jgi:TctA family transporter